MYEDVVLSMQNSELLAFATGFNRIRFRIERSPRARTLMRVIVAVSVVFVPTIRVDSAAVGVRRFVREKDQQKHDDGKRHV
jgi:hypothetical protein